jgi:deoxyribodipyrimidine photolyase-related protein
MNRADLAPPSTTAALRLVLGDQLSFDLASLGDLDPRHDRVLLAEVAEEAGHVPHHPQKIAFIFSAMRHFAEALRARGVTVDYVQFDDPANSGSLAGELVRFAARHRPQCIHITETGDWRVEQALRACDLPISWHVDRRFICSRDEFARWARGKKQLRMEYFYREMRRKTGLLLHPDGSPEGGAWNFDAENRKSLPRGLRGPMPARFPRMRSAARSSSWSASASPITTAASTASITRSPIPRPKPCGSTSWISASARSATTRTPWPAASRSSFTHGSARR